MEERRESRGNGNVVEIETMLEDLTNCLCARSRRIPFQKGADERSRVGWGVGGVESERVGDGVVVGGKEGESQVSILLTVATDLKRGERPRYRNRFRNRKKKKPSSLHRFVT